jgi:soluble lytic murein transglycosylase-like protein
MPPILLRICLCAVLVCACAAHSASAAPAAGPKAAVAPPTAKTSPAKPPSMFQQEQKMSFGQTMRRWNADIAEAANRFNLPAVWIRAVMQVESGGRTMLSENQPIKSNMGAMGLMQLMPQTWADMRAQYKLGNNAYDPHDNIIAGAAYLKWLKGKYGYPEMFAAYNDGPGHLDQRLQDAGLLPLETRNYLAKVTGVVEGRGAGLGGHGVLVKFTRPNGEAVMIDVAAVRSVRAAFPGEYDGCVQSVITVGRVNQGVCEVLAKTRAAIRSHGGAV